MWRTNWIEALEVNGFLSVVRRGAMIASGDLDAREESVENAWGARMRALDAIERRPDLSSLHGPQAVTGTRRGGGLLRGFGEDHGKGEKDERIEVKGSGNDPRNPSCTAVSEDRGNDRKKQIYIDRKGRPWSLEGL